MKLRNRVLLLFGMTLICLIAGIYLLSARFLLSGYLRLEQQQVGRNIERISSAFKQVEDDLHEKSYDWANGDDAYKFMTDRNRAYIASNLVDASLQGLRLDIILYVDARGGLFYAKTIRRMKEIPSPVPEQVVKALPFGKLYTDRSAQSEGLYGVLHLPDCPLLISIRPIRNSKAEGAPRGWLMFGRYFTQEETKKLAERTQLDVQFLRLDAPNLPSSYREIALNLSALHPYRIVPQNERILSGFSLIYDIQKRPLLLARLSHQRNSYLQGRASVQRFVQLIVPTALIICAVMLVVLERFVLSRLALLSRQVAGISDLRGRISRVVLPGRDELAGLAEKINTMLDVLEDNASRLRAGEEQLRAYSEGLEQAVADRTRELRDVNAVLEHALNGIARLDPQGCYLTVNAAYTIITGFAPEALLGSHWTSSIYPGDQGRIEEAFTLMHRQGKAETEARGVRPDGSLFYMQLVLIPSCDPAGKSEGSYCFLKDVTERKRLEDQIAYQAFHDALTGLPNRTLFVQELARIQAQTREASEQSLVAVLCLDLDNFKVINDSLGHEAGDKLLVAVAQRLVECVGPKDRVARPGGDEFTVLLNDLHHPEEVRETVERIIISLRQPVTLLEREVFTSVSIGIASSNLAANEPEAFEPDALLRDADTAMYQAKANGKSGYVFFDPSMNARVVERMEIENGLRHAIDRNELRVHYQPLIDLHSGRLVGTEALVRWQHPTRGLVSPSQFIPVAEATGMVISIGYWVLEEACRQTKIWQEQYPTEPPLSVSVNLSTKQLQQQDVVDQVASRIRRTDIPPASLKLEITESSLMGDMEEAQTKLHGLKALGVKLAIDDFGTGYSSMSYLNSLPVDTVKIDRAFISRLGETEEARDVVSAIIMLARALQLDVTGEGVETQAQVACLQGLGCHIGQGYYFARPVTGKEMHTHLTVNQSGEAGAFININDEADETLIEKLLNDLSRSGGLAA